jgi:photosystem II stability/assembly factor-like uncharacterized protein
MNIYILAFSFLFQFLSRNQASEFPQPCHLPDNQQKQKRDKAGDANIVFKSSDGGQTWQDISEGLSGKLEEGGFSLSRKIRICQVFYRQDPGQTQGIFVAPTLKGYEK